MCNFDGIKCNTTNISKAKTYRVALAGGIDWQATYHPEHGILDIEAFYANGENVQSMHEITYQPADMQRLADLFATVARELEA